MRILYADDDPEELSLFSEALKSIDRSIECITAMDGEEALEQLALQHDLQFIFLDLNMPKKSGKECLTLIRTNPQFKDVPVIIYSNAVNEEQAEKLYRGGAFEVLSKQWNIIALRQHLQRIFSLQHTAPRFH
jgi:CheY-like chemotaxis protein